MTTFNPKIHYRKSIRLKGYDYSKQGLYFVKICIEHKKWLLGEIKNNTMQLNNAGKMIKKWFYEIENKFPDIECGNMVIMPNHFHCIIKNTGSTTANVGADLCVCPHENNSQRVKSINEKQQYHKMGEHTGSNKMGEHTGSPLRNVIQWFKTMTTNEYIRCVKNHNCEPFNKRVWQRNYWEHIIRNEIEYDNIEKYIVENPEKWENDKLNGGTGNILMEPESEYDTENWMT